MREKCERDTHEVEEEEEEVVREQDQESLQQIDGDQEVRGNTSVTQVTVATKGQMESILLTIPTTRRGWCLVCNVMRKQRVITYNGHEPGQTSTVQEELTRVADALVAKSSSESKS